MAKEAYDWYEEQQLGLGDLFLAELDKGLDKLETWPLSYAKIKKDYRQLILHTFPYVIVYEIIIRTLLSTLYFTLAETPARNSESNS